jgi:hypothetical protein
MPRKKKSLAEKMVRNVKMGTTRTAARHIATEVVKDVGRGETRTALQQALAALIRGLLRGFLFPTRKSKK